MFELTTHFLTSFADDNSCRDPKRNPLLCF